MKYTKYLYIIAIAFTFLAISCKSDKSGEETTDDQTNSEEIQSAEALNRTIANGSLGGVMIGEDYLQISKIADRWAISEKQRDLDDGNTEPYYMVANVDGEKLLEIEREYDLNTQTYSTNIAGIRIFDETFSTSNGIKVGMTVKDMLKIYPEARFYYSYLGDWFWVEVNDYPQINFMLEPNGYNGDRIELGRKEADKLTADKFNNSTKIEAIYLYGGN